MKTKHFSKILTVQSCKYTSDHYTDLPTFLYTWKFSWRIWEEKRTANLCISSMVSNTIPAKDQWASIAEGMLVANGDFPTIVLNEL